MTLTADPETPVLEEGVRLTLYANYSFTAAPAGVHVNWIKLNVKPPEKVMWIARASFHNDLHWKNSSENTTGYGWLIGGVDLENLTTSHFITFPAIRLEDRGSYRFDVQYMDSNRIMNTMSSMTYELNVKGKSCSIWDVTMAVQTSL